MNPIADNGGANRELGIYLVHARSTLPADTVQELERYVFASSVVESVICSVELLYARRAELDDEGRTLVARLASFAASYGWNGMAIGNRGGRIWQAMNREMNVPAAPGQAAYPKAADDPPAFPQYERKAETVPPGEDEAKD